MRIYFAPMEGVTDAVYRRVHRRHFDGVDKYFLPFISPSHSMTFNRREKFDMSPEQNASMPAVPQILTNDETYFERLSAILRDLGYREVNLNLGCPSGTVTAKGKGSGLLREPDRLKLFLDGIFAHPILPVSVKTRIGYDDPGEWPALWSLLREYPFLEIILHPRTRQEFYTGTPHREACDLGRVHPGGRAADPGRLSPGSGADAGPGTGGQSRAGPRNVGWRRPVGGGLALLP